MPSSRARKQQLGMRLGWIGRVIVMPEKTIVDINGTEYEVPEEVADEIDRLSAIELAAKQAQLVMGQISVLIRAVTRQG